MGAEQALAICIAVRQERLDDARAAFGKMLALTDDAAVLRAVKAALLTAARRHQQELTICWLEQARPRLSGIIAKPALAADTAAFLQALVFAVCDRRLTEALPALTELVSGWLRANKAQTKLLAQFWGEWLSLAARMARRGWRTEAGWLLRRLGWGLWHQHDIKAWQNALQQLLLHFIVFVQWDGFAQACAAYKELQYFYLLLMLRAGSARLTQEERTAYLLLALRSIRTMTANAARSTMQDDMDSFRTWNDCLREFFPAAKRYRQQRLLVQLAINYWQSTLPKTSRKQVRYLEDLLQPDMITQEYRELLMSIC